MRLARIAALALLCGACTQAPPGKKLASGLARGLIAREGAVAFLLDAAHPNDPGVPDDLVAGDLWLDDRKVGSGVSSAEGAYAFSPDGSRLAFLASLRFARGEGQLWVVDRQGAPKQVATEIRTFAWSSKNELAFLRDDLLGSAKQTFVKSGLQAFLWSPDGRRIAVRSSAAAGGTLWSVDAETAAAREIAIGTSDFAFAADGVVGALGPQPPEGGDRPVIVDGARVGMATAFAFSPDGRELALLSTAKKPGESTGELYRMGRSGGSPRLVAAGVNEWRWGPANDLACLARYDLRARAGTLTVSSRGALPREIAARVQSFTLSGRRLLYVVQAPRKGDFRLELWSADLAAPESAPRKIDEGVYGWALSPDGSTLYYKARCAGGPRSCSLLRAPMSGGEAEFLAANVAGFDLSRGGTRLLLQQPHRGASRAVDLAVIPATGPRPEAVKPLVEEVDPSSRFADDGGKRVVYAVIAASRGGVFLADVP